MKLKIIATIFSILPLAIKLGCTLLPGTSEPATKLLGNWGGMHVALVIENDSATLEYDCGRGTIDEPIRLDRDGKFEARGVHIYEHGGPVRENEKPEMHPANYFGNVAGEVMTLTVKLSDTGDALGTFELKLGQVPRLFKCL